MPEVQKIPWILKVKFHLLFTLIKLILIDRAIDIKTCNLNLQTFETPLFNFSKYYIVNSWFKNLTHLCSAGVKSFYMSVDQKDQDDIEQTEENHELPC